jgi:hypothetical protein
LAAPVGGLAARLLGTELSDEFPNDGWEAVAWLFSALLVHGTAILVAERMRTRRVGDGRWLRVGSAGTRGTPANYITVAFACAIISSVPLFLFSLVFVEPSWGLARQLAPFSLLPSSTGAFFVWHLDNCDLGKRPSRTWEIGLQAIITGLCAGVAANMSGFALDLIALNAAVGAAIGASLAWYLPNAAMNSKEATQTEVTDESQKTSNVDLVHLSNDRIAA